MAGWNFKSSEDVKLYLQNLHAEYTYWCLKEKDPKGCHNLADYLEAIPKDIDKAREVYENNCMDHNFGKSCYKAGKYYLVGKGCTRDKAKAHELFVKGCEADCYEACTNAGLMYAARDKRFLVREDYNQSLKFLDKACKLGDAVACYNASGFFMGNLAALGSQPEKAFAYTKAACDLDHILACANLQLMYRRGDGTPKDLALAEKYKKKVQDYKTDLEDNIQLDFQRGI